MKTPKFQIGDVVKVKFEAMVEGVPVEVWKQLFVTGVAVDESFRRIEFTYVLREELGESFGTAGRKYSKFERELIPLEAVVNAIAHAQAAEDTSPQNSQSQTSSAPAPESNDQAPCHPES
jgi:hypothetical protein